MLTPADDIKNMTVPWLFQDIRKGKKSGTTIFEQDATVKKVFFKQGDIIFASSNRNEDRLGEFLLQNGKITQAQFDSSSDIVIKTGKKLGTVLFESGLLTPQDLVTQVKLQVKRIVLSLFGWRSGRCRFDAGSFPLTEIIPLQMSTGDLIIEGLHSLDGDAINGSLPAPQTILRPTTDPALLFQKGQLEQAQRTVISLIDGSKSIQEISCLSGLADGDTLKAIYVLLALRMAEIGDIKTSEEKDFACELVREAFVTRQAEKADPVAAQALVMKQTIQSAFDSLAIQNHYEVLGVSHGASAEEIKKAYFGLAKLYHPDRHFEPQMNDMKEKLEALFNGIHEAYETLNSPAARNQYNVDLASGTTKRKATDPAAPGGPIKKEAAVAQFHEGMKQFNAGNFWGADDAFQATLRLDPNNAEYEFHRGLALSRMPRRGHEAEEHFIKATQLAPKKTAYALELGNFYLRTEQKERARSVLQDALKYDPESEKIKLAIKKAGG